MKIITLLTDFGSFYPAQMKGVILSKLTDKGVTLVDSLTTSRRMT
jgi:S-adenosylmethionine hydrolase